jgi:hypothetical protein
MGRVLGRELGPELEIALGPALGAELGGALRMPLGVELGVSVRFRGGVKSPNGDGVFDRSPPPPSVGPADGTELEVVGASVGSEDRLGEEPEGPADG